MAVALDKEELEHYNFAALTHGKEAVKKWKWSSPDKAGTQITPDRATRANPGNISTNPLLENTIRSFMSQIDNDTRLQRAREYAATKGRPIGYQTPDGKLIDGDGKVIPKTPDLFVVKLNG